MTEAQLARERSLGRYAAGAAIIAIVLTVATVAIQASLKSIKWHGHTIKPTSYRSQAEALLLTHHQPQKYLWLTILGGLALVGMGFVLFYLYTATLARRPSVPGVLRWVTLIAPVFSGVVGVVNQINQTDAARKFFHLPFGQTLGPHGDHRATDLVRNASGAVQYIGVLAGILLILAFVVTSIYAMRTGILSRGMGYFGAAVGVLMLIPLLGPATTFVQILWLAALTVLFLDRWPGGRGPAWETGEAIPWPTPADRRAQQQEKRDEKASTQRPAPRPSGGELARRVRAASRGESDGGGAATAVSEPEDDAAPARQPHPRSKKRKRKRR